MNELRNAADIKCYLQTIHSINPAPNGALRKPDFPSFADANINHWHSTAAWMLDVGQEFTQAIPVSSYTDKYQDTLRQCYRNSMLLVAKHSELTYVEGYAFSGTVPICVTHAWCVNADGVVVDPTWSMRNGLQIDFSQASYYGVPMRMSFVEAVVSETGLYGVLDSLWMSSVGRGANMQEVLPVQFMEKHLAIN